MLIQGFRRSRQSVDAVTRIVFESELAGVVVFFNGSGTVVSVRVADEAVLVGIARALLFQPQSIFERLTHIAAFLDGCSFRDSGQRVFPQLEARKFVIGRQVGVGLGGSLDLRNLVDRLVFHAGFAVGLADRLAIGVHRRVEHQTIARIAVVWNRQQLRTVLASCLHVIP